MMTPSIRETNANPTFMGNQSTQSSCLVDPDRSPASKTLPIAVPVENIFFFYLTPRAL
jgi:hypothetical protein